MPCHFRIDPSLPLRTRSAGGPSSSPPRSTPGPADRPAAILDSSDEEETPKKPIEDPSLSVLTGALHALGLVAMPIKKYTTLAAKSIAVRLCNRKGKQVYQTVAYNLSLFSRKVAEDLFTSDLLLTSTPPSILTWKATTQLEVSTLLGSLLEKNQPYCAGATRALKEPMEKHVHVLSTIIAPLEITWANETLYFNFSFVLSDEAGELHPPKNNDRREILLEPAEETAIRAQILKDAKLMAEWGFPLSKGFLTLIGKTDEEAEAVASVAKRAKRRPPRPKAERPPKAAKAKAPSKGRAPRVQSTSESEESEESQESSSDESSEDEYEIEAILEARPTAGRARCWYLIRWAGYHPSWEAWRIMGEPGTPICTWAVARDVENTEAWLRWRQQ
jgi:hypothetical protein